MYKRAKKLTKKKTLFQVSFILPDHLTFNYLLKPRKWLCGSKPDQCDQSVDSCFVGSVHNLKNFVQFIHLETGSNSTVWASLGD